MWRRVGSSLTAATEGNNNFFRLVAVKHEVVGLSPVLYAVELRATRALVSCWVDHVRIVCILAHRPIFVTKTRIKTKMISFCFIKTKTISFPKNENKNKNKNDFIKYE